MANRILMQPDGLKISMPGHNVLTASGHHLLFDSNFHQAKRLIRGTLSYQFNSGERKAFFGRTFPKPPVCWIWMQSVPGSGTWGDVYDVVWGNTPETFDYRRTFIAEVQNDGIAFSGAEVGLTGSMSPDYGFYHIEYLVMEYAQ